MTAVTRCRASQHAALAIDGVGDYSRDIMDASAVWLLKPGLARIGTETLPEPGPGEVRVRARFGAVKPRH